MIQASNFFVTLREDGDPKEVASELARRGLWSSPRRNRDGQTTLAVEARSAVVNPRELETIPGVASVFTAGFDCMLLEKQPKIVAVGDQFIGEAPTVVAGPCSVESKEQIADIAGELAGGGVRFLRGGAFKPRTSPHSFHGHGVKGLEWMREAADTYGMQVVTECLSEEDADAVSALADVMQVGSRSMSSQALLNRVGRCGKPVLLKRGMASTIKEWLLCGERLLMAGASAVVFCERGIRSFDPWTRNVLDLGAVAMLSHGFGLLVMADPSHGAGRRDLVLPLAYASTVAGATGVMVEVHNDPGKAVSDGPQALTPREAIVLNQRLQDGFAVAAG